MTDAIMAAAGAVTAPGNQLSPVSQPTAQQAARFEAQLQGPASYGAPVEGTAGAPGALQTLAHDLGPTGADFRAQLLELQDTPATDYAALGLEPKLAAVFNHTSEVFDKTSRLTYSMFNFQLLTSVERVSSETTRTLYQQQG